LNCLSMRWLAKQREKEIRVFKPRAFCFFLGLCKKKNHHFGISQTKLIR
jgi:hypothetical protein